MDKKKPETLSDYLEHYVQENISLEGYKEYRKKKGLPLCGIVTFDDMENANRDAVRFISETDWSDYLKYQKRNLTKKVKAYFANLGINDAVFKQGKLYVMTEHMVYLVDHILEDRSGATDKILHMELHRVSKREYLLIYSLIEAAIRLGPASSEMKQQVQGDFLSFLSERVGGLGDPPEYYQNNVVDKIFRYARDIEPIRSIDELDWEIVVEKVYERLLENGVLVKKESSAWGSRLTEL